ncbi:helix-turn-helix transcriptional regulator [Robertmurraya sp. DFI.2.37]|uniref:helix-turn-helix domain-containing protein n=1 Tax=Robertmurraya sp. DFI.2.37 TaxID=3031819 RepID=UPI0012469B3C|nr:helix-turn-helix transcriptional regulator [Robertmurraya sp. DFI.2.37]MDF1511047.1 helix-turn-helix transcriptional regulator [Robertmurraya sp. DFI.2.37]
MSQENKVTIPITIHLLPSAFDKLEKIKDYLSIRYNQEKQIEGIIKGAIVDFLDIMFPVSDVEIFSIKALILDDTKYVIRNRIKDIMKNKKIKSVEIHRNTGISESTLSQILNNKSHNMSLDYFLRIWLALDCPPIGDCLYKENIK